MFRPSPGPGLSRACPSGPSQRAFVDEEISVIAEHDRVEADSRPKPGASRQFNPCALEPPALLPSGARREVAKAQSHRAGCAGVVRVVGAPSRRRPRHDDLPRRLDLVDPQHAVPVERHEVQLGASQPQSSRMDDLAAGSEAPRDFVLAEPSKRRVGRVVIRPTREPRAAAGAHARPDGMPDGAPARKARRHRLRRRRLRPPHEHARRPACRARHAGTAAQAVSSPWLP